MAAGQITPGLINGPGESWSYGGRYVDRRGKEQQWKKAVTQFIQRKDKTWVENPYYWNTKPQSFQYKPGGRGKDTWWKPDWNTKPSKPAQDSRQLLDRVDQDTAFNTLKGRENSLFKDGADQRDAARKTADNQFSDSVTALAQARVNQRNQLMGRAGRLGLGFSQGRMNAINQLNSRFDVDTSNTKNAYDQAIAQLTREGSAADKTRTFNIDQAWADAEARQIGLMRSEALGVNRPNYNMAALGRRGTRGIEKGKFLFTNLDNKTGQAYRLLDTGSQSTRRWWNSPSMQGARRTYGSLGNYLKQEGWSRQGRQWRMNAN